MSTRCTIEVVDTYKNKEGKLVESKHPVLLYHHSDGYPSFMGPYLEEMLTEAYKYLQDAGYPYWWDSERVSAVIVVLSMMEYETPTRPEYSKIAKETAKRKEKQFGSTKYHDGGVPYFQPCGDFHGDIEYIWRVVLLDEGKFEIKCYDVQREKDDIKRGRKIDWH
jgi:hypothetical protein